MGVRGYRNLSKKFRNLWYNVSAGKSSELQVKKSCWLDFAFQLLNLFMLHYVCLGSCGGESNQPKICEAEFCSKEGQDMASCECEDGSHGNAGKEPEVENPDLS